jgi:outer membrane protein OmpA-like peptidoglycan-associated protein
MHAEEYVMRSTLTLVAFLTLISQQLAQAQPTTLLQEDQISESALVDALTPPARTRGFKPVSPPSASLLITFETNSARLTSPAEHSLDKVGAALKNPRLADRSFVIEGHADKRGRADANKRLSSERAEAVRSYLTRKHNIAEARLKAVGKGDSEPLNLNDPAAPENRRVTFITATE